MKEQRAVVPFNSNLPLASETLSWDWNTVSQNEILGDTGDNWELYKKAHLYFDENKNMETKSAYKLPIAKIVDGELKVIFRALVAAVGAINGARGGVELPNDERTKIYENIKKYYAKFNKEVPQLVNLSKELQETETALDNTNNLSNSSINKTNSNRSEDMNKEDMQGIIAEVTKSVLEAMNSERQERSVPEATNTVNTRSVQGNDIIDIAHGTKEPTIEQLKARLEQAEHTLSRVLAQPLRKGRHTTTSIRGIGAEVEMVSVSQREGKMKEALSKVKEKYDYVIIDCSPSLGLITVNALTAADSVIVPVQCEYFALEGLGKLLNTIKIIQNRLNPELEIEGILLTMYDLRLNLSNQVVEEVRTHFKSMAFETLIPRNIKLSESPSFGVPAISHDAESKGSLAYLNLAREIMQRNEVTA